MPYCRACPAEIFFAQQNPTEKNPSPANNPLCAKPDREKGNLRVDFSTMKYDVLSKEEAAAARERGEDLYLSHYANCPNRGKFGKGKKR